MSKIVFLVAAFTLAGCDRSPSAKLAAEVIKQCNGTASIEMHYGMFYESMTTKCQWEKKATP